MVKHIIFSTILNVLIIASVAIGYWGYNLGNFFIPILCTAAFGLSVFYKWKHLKVVREEMKLKANQNLNEKTTNKNKL